MVNLIAGVSLREVSFNAMSEDKHWNKRKQQSQNRKTTLTCRNTQAKRDQPSLQESKEVWHTKYE